METHLELRASSSPVAVKCPMSIRHNAESADREAGDAALTGTRAHKLFQAIVEGTRWDAGDDDELRFLAYTFKRLWEDGDEGSDVLPLSAYFDGAANVCIEEKLSWGGITGHMDLGFYSPDAVAVYVMDWKTGRARKGSYWPQLLTYAVLYWMAFGDKGSSSLLFHLFLVDVRAGEWEARTFSLEEVLEHSNRLLAAMELAESGDPGQLNLYTTGEHCRWCNGANVCPAINREIAVFEGFRGEQPSVMDAVNALSHKDWGRIDATARTIKALVERYEDARKARVIAEGGFVDFGDGTGLRMQGETRREVSFVAAREVIESVIETGANPDKFLKVSLSSLQSEAVRAAKEAAGGKLALGGVGALKKEIEERLRGDCAISETTIQKCVLVDVDTKIEGEG